MGLYAGYAIVWLLLALLAAAAPIIIVGLIPGPSPRPPFEQLVVLSVSAVAFGLCWPVCIWWVLQRRRRARAFVRDAVLLDGVIHPKARGAPGRGMGTGAVASFQVDRFERRADLGLGLGSLEGPASILFAPGAGAALVFPNTLQGRPVRAQVRGDIIDRAGLVSVVLRRGFFETFFAFALGLFAVGMLLSATEAAPADRAVAWPVAILIALFCGWCCWRLTDGWRTTLTFDASAGALMITRLPALAPPWPRALPLSSIATVDLRSGMLILQGVVMRTLTLRLRDSNGKVLFSRWQLTGADMKQEIDAVLQKVRSN